MSFAETVSYIVDVYTFVLLVVLQVIVVNLNVLVYFLGRAFCAINTAD